jgi:mannose-6-phosphate isomerase-like protein (cupin superfamily)
MVPNYKDCVVEKPWGYEYLVFETEDVALWLLYIKKNEATSLHCHPNKTTGLIVVEGSVEITFVNDKRVLNHFDKAMIRRGLFHSTKSLSELGSYVLEIETPNDKADLVRLNDLYGRSSTGYEKNKSLTERGKKEIWISEPQGGPQIYQIGNQVFNVQHVNNFEFFEKLNDQDIVMFLRGGLGKTVDERRLLATMPGDVLKGNILKILSLEMEFIEENSLVALFENNK